MIYSGLYNGASGLGGRALRELKKKKHLVPLPTTVTIHTSTYVKPDIHTADMRNVIMNHFLQKPLRQSGMVRNSRVMMGRDKTHSILLRSLSGMANTLLCSDGTKEEKPVAFPAFAANR